MTLPLDKRAHLLGGSTVALLATVAGAPPWAAFLAGVLVGAAKEAYDASGGGCPEWLDFGATAAGSAAGAGLAWIVQAW